MEQDRSARGRPSLDIDMARVTQLLNAGYKMQAVASEMRVSTMTIRRRLTAAGDSYRHHLPDGELLQHINSTNQTRETGRAAGHRMVQAALRVHGGVRAPRQQVLHAMRTHDPDGNAARLERIIPRGNYNITEGMVVWHIDGYEKLKMFGFHLHAGIDGGSNFVVYAQLSHDKRAATLFEAYSSAVAAFGRPLRLRADMCLEAMRIGQDMINHRGPGAYITGPSTSNQRIERFWNYAWSHWASYYRQLFEEMEDRGLLDRFAPADLFSLGQVFMPRMQQRILDVCQTWNYHPIRPQSRRGISTYIPAHRFRLGLAAVASVQGGDVTVAAEPPPDLDSVATESNHGSAASDSHERASGAPAVADPLRGAERALRDDAYGLLDLDEERVVHNYLAHRQVTREAGALRAYRQPGGTYDWQAFLAELVHAPQSNEYVCRTALHAAHARL